MNDLHGGCENRGCSLITCTKNLTAYFQCALLTSVQVFEDGRVHITFGVITFGFCYRPVFQKIRTQQFGDRIGPIPGQKNNRSPQFVLISGVSLNFVPRVQNSFWLRQRRCENLRSCNRETKSVQLISAAVSGVLMATELTQFDTLMTLNF